MELIDLDSGSIPINGIEGIIKGKKKSGIFNSSIVYTIKIYYQKDILNSNDRYYNIYQLKYTSEEVRNFNYTKLVQKLKENNYGFNQNT